MGRSPCSNACQVVLAFPLHKFRVFVLMELIISLFPLLPDVSCLPASLLLVLPFVSSLFPGSGKYQTSVSPCPLGWEHIALCPFTGCTLLGETLEIPAPPDHRAAPWEHRQVWIE